MKVGLGVAELVIEGVGVAVKVFVAVLVAVGVTTTVLTMVTTALAVFAESTGDEMDAVLVTGHG